MRRKNPIDPKQAPPKAVYSYGGQSTWRYRGREIQVVRDPNWKPGQYGKFGASWPEPEDEGDEQAAFATDEQGALANARHQIDVHERQKTHKDYWAADNMVAHVIDYLNDFTTGPIDRATVARAIEEARLSLTRQGRARVGGTSLPIREWGMDAFQKLPLKERLRMIDEGIDYQGRSGLVDAKRLKSTPMAQRRNPKKRRKKNPCCKQIRREGRAAVLRRIMRL